jgi:hypothetical protein
MYLRNNLLFYLLLDPLTPSRIGLNQCAHGLYQINYRPLSVSVGRAVYASVSPGKMS